MEQQFGAGRLVLVQGDITTIAADAIGNAANAALAGGGGVDGAIHRAGGPEIMAELRARHAYGTPAGTAVATGAGALPARWVIHAVGPVWRGGDHGEPTQLSGAYRSALSIAAELGARTLTLPASISRAPMTSMVCTFAVSASAIFALTVSNFSVEASCFSVSFMMW